MSTQPRYLTANEDRTALKNPYQIGEPAAVDRFVGRAELFTWIKERVGETEGAAAVYLFGPAGSGKSSILKQLEADRLALPYYFVWISCRRLQLHNVAGFLWSLVNEIGQSLERHGISIRRPERSALVARPQGAFKQQFLTPLMANLDRQGLVLMLDDTEVLFVEDGGQLPTQELRQTLHQLSLDQESVRLLFSLAGDEAAVAPATLAPFVAEHTQPVAPLERDDVFALLAEDAPFKVYDEIADYVYALTGGQPAEVQRLGYALFERWRLGKAEQITLTDVVAARRAELNQDSRPTRHLHGVHARPLSGQQEEGRNGNPYLYVGTLLITLLLLLGSVFLPHSRALSLEGPVAALSHALGWRSQGPATASTIDARGTVRDGAAAAVTRVTRTSVPSSAGPPTGTPTAPATATSTPTPTITLTPSVTPTPSLPVRTIRESDQMAMVLIPAGTFVMGSSGDDWRVAMNETPQHEVTVDHFYLDQYEVTVSQFALFLNELGDFRQACAGYHCALPRNRVGVLSYLLEMESAAGLNRYSALDGYGDYPINYVSWYGAHVYCESMGARLPTEAEWEYGARGNDGRIYPWGDETPDETRAIFSAPEYASLQPVDALAAGTSPFDVYGMAGSMWEWVADWYDGNYYRTSPAANPPGPAVGFLRVTRGGAWPRNVGATRIRVTHRNPLEPTYMDSSVGFRCARDAPSGNLP